MKTLIIATGIALATTASAFAQSSALDHFEPEPVNRSALIDFQATKSIRAPVVTEFRDRLGDGAPQYINRNVRRNAGVDYAPTSSIKRSADRIFVPRLGDGAPVYR
ncbi:hypothetical protein [Oricola sp.]|uniref:hypothetical protein n=1 Tax=Oricola sp. TaxID=1979950 RepID=UPI003BACEDAD